VPTRRLADTSPLKIRTALIGINIRRSLSSTAFHQQIIPYSGFCHKCGWLTHLLCISQSFQPVNATKTICNAPGILDHEVCVCSTDLCQDCLFRKAEAPTLSKPPWSYAWKPDLEFFETFLLANVFRFPYSGLRSGIWPCFMSCSLSRDMLYRIRPRCNAMQDGTAG
jgi:hypothetical protein